MHARRTTNHQVVRTYLSTERRFSDGFLGEKVWPMRASGSARAPASRRRFRSPTRRHGIWLFCSLKYTISQGFVSRPINSFSTSSFDARMQA